MNPCPRLDEAHDFGDGEMPEEARAAFRWHLRACHQCRDAIDEERNRLLQERAAVVEALNDGGEYAGLADRVRALAAATAPAEASKEPAAAWRVLLDHAQSIERGHRESPEGMGIPCNCDLCGAVRAIAATAPVTAPAEVARVTCKVDGIDRFNGAVHISALDDSLSGYVTLPSATIGDTMTIEVKG